VDAQDAWRVFGNEWSMWHFAGKYGDCRQQWQETVSDWVYQNACIQGFDAGLQWQVVGWVGSRAGGAVMQLLPSHHVHDGYRQKNTARKGVGPNETLLIVGEAEGCQGTKHCPQEGGSQTNTLFLGQAKARANEG